MLRVKKNISPSIDISGNIIDEKEYMDSYGGTRDSLKFWKQVKPIVSEITHAKMTYSEKDHYNFYFLTKNGATIHFRGIASGFGGEGPRGCRELLIDAGFSEEQAQAALERHNFFLAKRGA